MPNALTRFGLTDLEINAEMARSPLVMMGLQDLMGRMVAAWKGLAPVFGDLPPHRNEPLYDEPGAYRDSIHSEPMRRRDGLPGGRVGTSYYTAGWIELGSRHMPEYGCAAQVAALFGSTTGPIFSEGVMAAQGKLREALEVLAKARAGHAGGLSEALGRASDINAAKRGVERARNERSAAFKAAKSASGPRRRGRSR